MYIFLWPTLPKPNIKEQFLYLDSHLIEKVASVADFVIGSLKLCLQFIHHFLTLLQLALETRNTKCPSLMVPIAFHCLTYPLNHKMLLVTIWIKGGVCGICLEKLYIYILFHLSLMYFEKSIAPSIFDQSKLFWSGASWLVWCYWRIATSLKHVSTPLVASNASSW